MDSFESVLAALAREQVSFIVVGGLATVQAGYVRLTEVIGLLVQADRPNLAKMIQVLSGVGSGAAAELTPDDFPLEEGAVRVAESFDIDLFTQMSGHRYEDLFPLANHHDVLGRSVAFLSPEGLIRLKKDSLRPQDQLDVQALTDLLRRRSG